MATVPDEGYAQQSAVSPKQPKSQTQAKGQGYQGTKLPFEAKGVSIAPGGDFSTDSDGAITKPTGMTIESLSLKTLDIPLQSHVVSSDCMITTKDYGKLKIKVYFGSGGRYSILVTPKQEALFQQLLATQK